MMGVNVDDGRLLRHEHTSDNHLNSVIKTRFATLLVPSPKNISVNEMSFHRVNGLFFKIKSIILTWWGSIGNIEKHSHLLRWQHMCERQLTEVVISQNKHDYYLNTHHQFINKCGNPFWFFTKLLFRNWKQLLLLPHHNLAINALH